MKQAGEQYGLACSVMDDSGENHEQPRHNEENCHSDRDHPQRIRRSRAESRFRLNIVIRGHTYAGLRGVGERRTCGSV